MRLVFAAASAVLLSSAAAAQQAQNWNFEDGTLQGWTAVGDAFAHQPTLGNNIEPRRPGESPGSTGDWWIGSYENRQSASVPLGTVQGDGPTGYLISPPFVMEPGTVSFLIGGGHDVRSAVAVLMLKVPGSTGGAGQVLISDGYYRAVAGISGNDQEFMSRVGWDTRPYGGAVGRIVLSDQGSGGWGHINADDFRFSWVNEAIAPRNFPGGPTPVFRKPPPAFRPSRPLPMPPGDLFGGSMILLPSPDGKTPQFDPPAPIMPEKRP